MVAPGHSLEAVSMDSATEVASLEATILRPDGTMIHTPVPSSTTRRKQHRSESMRQARMPASAVLNARDPARSKRGGASAAAALPHESISDRVRSRRASQDAAPIP
jgi:hypothetical protein